MSGASLRRDPAFPHLCPGAECAICRWLRRRDLRAAHDRLADKIVGEFSDAVRDLAKGVPIIREGEAPGGGEDFASSAKRLPGPVRPIVLTFDPKKP